MVVLLGSGNETSLAIYFERLLLILYFNLLGNEHSSF